MSLTAGLQAPATISSKRNQFNMIITPDNKVPTTGWQVNGPVTSQLISINHFTIMIMILMLGINICPFEININLQIKLIDGILFEEFQLKFCSSVRPQFKIQELLKFLRDLNQSECFVLNP